MEKAKKLLESNPGLLEECIEHILYSEGTEDARDYTIDAIDLAKKVREVLG